MYPQAKKSLGQNFLNGGRTIEHIVDTMNLDITIPVFEIGPGRGVLTRELLKRGVKVASLEADHDLIPILQEEFASEIENGTFTLLEGDITNFRYEEIVGGKYQVVANIPFYITGLIFRRILEEASVLPQRVCLIIQKEVADRIVKRDGDSSILSHSIEIFGTPKYLKTIARGSFSPAPNVDAGLLSIENIKKPELPTDLAIFFSLIKTLYRMPRKTIRNNLMGSEFESLIPNLSEELLIRRPETLTFQEVKDILGK
ncbi:MAG TPA: rRNA adenine dimethyltransferase family protein [Candidatus Paceibacterota bacterium]